MFTMEAELDAKGIKHKCESIPSEITNQEQEPSDLQTWERTPAVQIWPKDKKYYSKQCDIQVPINMIMTNLETLLKTRLRFCTCTRDRSARAVCSSQWRQTSLGASQQCSRHSQSSGVHSTSGQGLASGDHQRSQPKENQDQGPSMRPSQRQTGVGQRQ